METVNASAIEFMGFLVILATLLLVPPWIITHKKYWGWISLPIAWLLHLGVFYLFVNLENLGLWNRPFSGFFISWSAILRLQGIFSFFLALVLTIPWREIWKISE